MAISTPFLKQLQRHRKNQDTAAGKALIAGTDPETLGAEELHEIARFYYASGDTGQAGAFLVRAGKRYPPGLREVAADLAMVAAKAGNPEVEIYFSLVSQDPRRLAGVVKRLLRYPEFAEAVATSAQAMLAPEDYHLLQCQAAMDARNHPLALENARKAVEARDTPEAWLHLAKANYNLKRYGVAQEMLESRLQALDRDFRAHELLALIHTHFGRNRAALAAIENACRINPRFRSGRGRAARLKYLLEDYDGALADIQVALRHYPKMGEFWATKGRIEVALGHYESAREAFGHEDAIARSAISALNLAYSHALLGDHARSEACRREAVERSYVSSLRASGDDKTLFLVLSPAGGLILTKYRFAGTVLHCADTSGTYFILPAQAIARQAKEIADSRGIDRIVLIGSSKGAFGALLIGALLAGYDRLQVRAFAFSPQVVLWPFNDNLKMPSYRMLMERSKGNALLREMLERHGNANRACEMSPALAATAILGSGYDMDVKEAALLTAPNVERRTIPFSGHGTLMVYTIPEGLTADQLAQKYAALKQDDDDVAVLGQSDGENIIDEMVALYFDGRHTLDGLLRSALAPN